MTHNLMPDVSGILLVASSWMPLMVISWSSYIAYGLGMTVSVLAIVDYSFKIHWKLIQRKRERLEKRKKEEEQKQNDNGGKY